jgi:DNA damage-binding protein 1
VASGSANTNSLRIVRSGVGLESKVSVEGIAGIERVWAYDGAEEQDDAMLIVSFAASTLIFNVGAEITQVNTGMPLQLRWAGAGHALGLQYLGRGGRAAYA